MLLLSFLVMTSPRGKHLIARHSSISLSVSNASSPRATAVTAATTIEEDNNSANVNSNFSVAFSLTTSPLASAAINNTSSSNSSSLLQRHLSSSLSLFPLSSNGSGSGNCVILVDLDIIFRAMMKSVASRLQKYLEVLSSRLYLQLLLLFQYHPRTQQAPPVLDVARQERHPQDHLRDHQHRTALTATTAAAGK